MYPYKYTGQITIDQVLADMRKSPDRVFWLAFCRATGKDRGKLKIVSRCKYGAAKPRSYSGPGMAAAPKERNITLHVDAGTIPVHSADTGEYLTPLISHLEGYNLKKIIHGNN